MACRLSNLHAITRLREPLTQFRIEAGLQLTESVFDTHTTPVRLGQYGLVWGTVRLMKDCCAEEMGKAIVGSEQDTYVTANVLHVYYRYKE